MKVRLSGSARAYLRAEAAYLRDFSPRAAAGFLARIREVQRNLARFPELGRGIERLPVQDSRRLVAGEYIVDYDLLDGSIVIMSIRHSKQAEAVPEIDEDVDYEENPETQ